MRWAWKCWRAVVWSRATPTPMRADFSKFDRVMSVVPTLASRDDGAVWLDRLKRAALADEDGTGLDGMLKTVASL